MRIRSFVVVSASIVVASLLVAAPSGAQTRRAAPPPAQSDTGSNLKMREMGIQGEHQRPDVLFVIPTGRGGPIVSPRLRDYSYDIQEPVVKPWLEAESRIAHTAVRNEGSTPDWREAVRAAAAAPQPRGAVPMPQIQMQTAPRTSEPGIPREALQSPPSAPSGPRSGGVGIPREALQFPSGR
jgi:hypothetical protein